MSCQFTITAKKDSKSVDLSKVNEQSLQQLVDQLREDGISKVTIKAEKIYQWPKESQLVFWRTADLLAEEFTLCLQVGKIKAKCVRDCAIGLAVEHAGSPSREDALRSALCAIHATCDQLAMNAALSTLRDRMRGVGFSISLQTLRAALAELQTDNTDKPCTDPKLLAKGFAIALRTQRGLAVEDRVLNFFNGEFYSWNNGHWKAVVEQEMRGSVVQYLQACTPALKVTTKLTTDVIENLKGEALLACSREPLPFVVEEYGLQPMIRRANYVVFSNGMIDIDAGAAADNFSLEPLNSNFFTSSQLPFDYQPDAACPRFLRMLYRILEVNPRTQQPLQAGDRRLSVLQEFFGYTLLRDGRMQKFLVMVGDGANGKSVVLHLWNKMLGEQNVSHVGLDQLSGQFALEPLIGMAANICGDLNEIDAVAEGVLKQLTGEDNITVHRKHRTSITMRPAMKLIFATNALPRFKDKSEGVWRRLIAMPFRVTIPEAEQDETLATSLEEELPGIIVWALQGLLRLLRQGNFTSCTVCNALKRVHQRDCDPVQQFIEECLSLAEGATSLRHEVYERYQQWCQENGRHPMNNTEFGKQLRKRVPSIREARSGTGRRAYTYRNIHLPGGSVPAPEPSRRHRRSCRT